ncbi:MAG: hypothetical protein R3D02_02795 [Hyphomicrobiales bacterium]
MPVALVLSTRIVPLMVGVGGIFLLVSIFVAGDMRSLFTKFRTGAGKPLTLIALLLCGLALMAPLLGSPVPLDLGSTARFAGSFGLILAWWALAHIAPPPDRSLLINISAAGVAIAAALIVLELETPFGIRHMLGISSNPSILNRPIVGALVLGALLVSDVRDRHERHFYWQPSDPRSDCRNRRRHQSATLFLVVFSATYVLARLLPRPVLVLGRNRDSRLPAGSAVPVRRHVRTDIPALADFLREAHVEHRITIWHDYAQAGVRAPGVRLWLSDLARNMSL